MGILQGWVVVHVEEMGQSASKEVASKETCVPAWQSYCTWQIFRGCVAYVRWLLGMLAFGLVVFAHCTSSPRSFHEAAAFCHFVSDCGFVCPILTLNNNNKKKIEELELHLDWKQWSREHREENKAKSPWAFCSSVKYRIFFSSWRKTDVNNV